MKKKKSAKMKEMLKKRKTEEEERKAGGDEEEEERRRRRRELTCRVIVLNGERHLLSLPVACEHCLAARSVDDPPANPVTLSSTT